MPAQQSINRLDDRARLRANRFGGSWSVVTVAIALSGALAAIPLREVFASERVVEAGELSASKREWAVMARWENDTFGGTDRFYTDGLALAVLQTGPGWMDTVADWVPWGQGHRTVGYDLAQAIFTPSDKDLTVPDPNDRPYAGVLALGLTLHVEKDLSYHGLKFVTGVVGPAARAEETQKAVHEIISATEPQGWDYQLHDEPILNLAYEYRHKFQLAGERDRWNVQALPLVGGWLGNMLIQGQVGGLVRFTEAHRSTSGLADLLIRSSVRRPSTAAEATAMVVEHALDTVPCAGVFVPTRTGATARMISRFKPKVWIVALSRDAAVRQGLAFSYGVHAVHLDDHPDSWRNFTRDWLHAHALPGDVAMLVAGPSTRHPDANHRLEFLRVGDGPSTRQDQHPVRRVIMANHASET